jgi:DNA-binding NtrC family response regulator
MWFRFLFHLCESAAKHPCPSAGTHGAAQSGTAHLLASRQPAAQLLERYAWPGNIRELKNVIERTIILAPESNIDAFHLPEEIRDAEEPVKDEPLSFLDISLTGRQLVSLRELEDQYIQEVLLATGNNKTPAAKILGIHPTSLLRRLKKEHALT